MVDNMNPPNIHLVDSPFTILLDRFGASFQLFNMSYNNGMVGVTKAWNDIVNQIGFDNTIKAVLEHVSITEGWTDDDKEVINKISGRNLYVIK